MMHAIEARLCAKGISEGEWDEATKHIHCMPHICNLGVVDTLKALTMNPFCDALAAAKANLTDKDLKDPAVALHGLIAAIHPSHCYTMHFVNFET